MDCLFLSVLCSRLYLVDDAAGNGGSSGVRPMDVAWKNDDKELVKIFMDVMKKRQDEIIARRNEVLKASKVNKKELAKKKKQAAQAAEAQKKREEEENK